MVVSCSSLHASELQSTFRWVWCLWKITEDRCPPMVSTPKPNLLCPQNLLKHLSQFFPIPVPISTPVGLWNSNPLTLKAGCSHDHSHGGGHSHGHQHHTADTDTGGACETGENVCSHDHNTNAGNTQDHDHSHINCSSGSGTSIQLTSLEHGHFHENSRETGETETSSLIFTNQSALPTYNACDGNQEHDHGSHAILVSTDPSSLYHGHGHEHSHGHDHSNASSPQSSPKSPRKFDAPSLHSDVNIQVTTELPLNYHWVTIVILYLHETCRRPSPNPIRFQKSSYIHTRTNTDTRTYTLTQTHTYHWDTHIPLRHTRAYTYTYRHTYIHTYTDTHIPLRHTHPNKYIHAHKDIHWNALAHTHTHTRTHTYIFMLTYTNTYTQTYTIHTHKIQAAYLHVITDTIQSIAVAIAGLVIWIKPTWQIVDPIASLLFSVLVLWTTVPLLERVMTILLEGVPAHIDWSDLYDKLKAIEGVIEVDHLHIWYCCKLCRIIFVCIIRAIRRKTFLSL